MRLTAVTNITTNTTWNEDIVLDHGQYVINITPGTILYLSGTTSFNSITPCSLIINYGTVQIDGNNLTNGNINMVMNNCYLHISCNATVNNNHMINTHILGYMSLQDSILDNCVIDDDVTIVNSSCNHCKFNANLHNIVGSNINGCTITHLSGSVNCTTISSCSIGNICELLEITNNSSMLYIMGNVLCEFLRDSIVSHITGDVNVTHESRLSTISYINGNVSVKRCKTNCYSHCSGNVTLDICENSDIWRIDGTININYLLHSKLYSNQEVSINIGTAIESTIEDNSGCLTVVKNITRSNYRCNHIGDAATTTFNNATNCRIVDNDSYQECVGIITILSGSGNIVRDNCDVKNGLGI